MAKFPNTVHLFGEGIQVVAETQLIGPAGIDPRAHLRISDVAVASDGACIFWLSTGVAGAAGHFYSLYLAAAGNMKVALESPILIAGGNSVYMHYNGGTAMAAGSWTGELFV